MNSRFFGFIFFLVFANSALSQQEAINAIDDSLEAGERALTEQQYDDVISKARFVFYFNFDSLVIPVTGNVKRDYSMQHFDSDSRENAAQLMTQAFFNQKQYDSCLFYREHVYISRNSHGLRYNSYWMMKDIHFTYITSVCLEQLGKKEEARKILVRYLLLDRIQTDRANWFTQRQLVDRYLSLAVTRPKLDVSYALRKEPGFFGSDFPAWDQCDVDDLFYKIEGIDCPVLNSFDCLLVSNAPLKLETDVQHPFLNAEAEKDLLLVDYQDAYIKLRDMRVFVSGN